MVCGIKDFPFAFIDTRCRHYKEGTPEDYISTKTTENGSSTKLKPEMGHRDDLLGDAGP
jgi:hypothetical protein